MSILGGSTINISAGPPSGIGVGNPVDSRAVTGIIVPDTSGAYPLGADNLRFSHIFATSGVFGTESVLIEDGIAITKNSVGSSFTVDHFSESQAAIFTQNTNQIALQIDKDATGGGVPIQVNNSGTGAGINVNQGNTAFGIQVQQSSNQPCVSLENTNGAFTERALFVKATRAANSAFTLAEFLSDNGGDPKVRLRGDGAIQSDIAASTPADYAEYFETQDPSGIDAGLGVKLNSSGLLEVADLADKIIGFVSAAPGVITDSAWSSWHNKYLKTEFGAYQLDENGDRTLNPAWDPELPYTSRENRPEWITVGVLGKIWVRTGDEVLAPGDLVKIDNNGLVTDTPSTENSWQVIASGLTYDAGRGYGTARILYK